MSAGIYRAFGKSIFDFAFSLTALLLFSPLLILLACLIAVFLGRPVLFSQERAGKNGKIFKMLKFRSMTNERDAQGSLLPDEKRLTAFGKFLRATSLDELPELLNIVRGEMSLVGPRPLFADYLPLYSPEQARRHEVKPGLTGWAQINGRNALDWDSRFEQDVWYVDNQSFALDLKILLLTALKVLTRDGVSAQGHATMPRFTGSRAG